MILPSATPTGLVDSERYYDNWIHFPAHWHDPNFKGVLPKGTPVAQCIPVKRESWVARTACFTREETQRAHDLSSAINRETGIYRRQFAPSATTPAREISRLRGARRGVLQRH